MVLPLLASAGSALMSNAPALITAGAGLFSGQQGANATANAAKAARRAEEEKYNRKKQAYDEMINRSKDLASGGEQGFLSAQGEQMAGAQTPLAELTQAKQDAISGNAAALQQGAGQMKTNLTQSGVRGGQAAMLLNRGTGQQSVDANQLINQMAVDEASERRKLQQNSLGAKMGLYGQKAGAGYSGQLQQFGG